MRMRRLKHGSNKSSIWSKLRNITLVATDVDGIMTDGTLVYSSDGEALKFFHAQDGLGVGLLRKAGIDIAVISGRDSPALRRRVADLGIVHAIFASKDKMRDMTALARNLGFDLANIAYLGDDVVDIELLERCGLGVTVPTAPGYVQRKADWVLNKAGGQGALREFIDMLLNVGVNRNRR